MENKIGLIKENLKAENIDITYKECTGSTNTDLKNEAKSNPRDGRVIIADLQTAGRGRLGRSFYSPKDSGIYLSYLIVDEFDISIWVKITTAVSVAVCRAIEDVTETFPQIKWVNDLYLNNKKICGILCETVSDTETGKICGVVAGVGINYSTASFPSEISDIAGSIGTAEELKYKLVAEIINRLAEVKEMISTGDYIAEYKKRSMVLGKEIYILGEEKLKAKAVDIDENGGLVAELADGSKKTLTTGEVSIRLV